MDTNEASDVCCSIAACIRRGGDPIPLLEAALKSERERCAADIDRLAAMAEFLLDDDMAESVKLLTLIRVESYRKAADHIRKTR